ncbi:MAG: hypothetical protein IPP72_10965 [Chitinophagaceae bacterium]|nr:hypothetical protein [Chitinophagaceae bacterium]
MAIWTSNNLACVNLWSTLYIMKQHKKTFKKAEKLKMKELLFFNPLLTEDELKFEAAGIADFLDIVFKNTYGGKYEDGIDKAKAVNHLVDTLIEGDKTMADLAAAVDDDYNF